MNMNFLAVVALPPDIYHWVSIYFAIIVFIYLCYRDNKSQHQTLDTLDKNKILNTSLIKNYCKKT